MDLKQPKINYEKQIFDELDINPYEVVIAVSKKAREINDRTLKYLGPEVEIKPIGIAPKKLRNENTKFVYGDNENIDSPEESSAQNNNE